MNRQRILAACDRLEACDTLIARVKSLAERLEAGVTLLFVREDPTVELPGFETPRPSLREILEKLQHRLREARLQEWAVLVQESDVADRILLEADREKPALSVVKVGDATARKLLEDLPGPVLLLDDAACHYTRVLLAVDLSYRERGCMPWLKKLLPESRMKAYMDYQFFPTLEDGSVDPVVGAMIPEIVMDHESKILKAHEDRFRTWCRETGIDGVFEVGENGLEEDLKEQLRRQDADLLVVLLEDRETVLAESVRELAGRLGCDMLQCINEQE